MQCQNCGSKQFIPGRGPGDMVVCRECGEPGDSSTGRPYHFQPGGQEVSPSEMQVRDVPQAGQDGMGSWQDSGGSPLTEGFLDQNQPGWRRDDFFSSSNPYYLPPEEAVSQEEWEAHNEQQAYHDIPDLIEQLQYDYPDKTYDELWTIAQGQLAGSRILEQQVPQDWRRDPMEEQYDQPSGLTWSDLRNSSWNKILKEGVDMGMFDEGEEPADPPEYIPCHNCGARMWPLDNGEWGCYECGNKNTESMTPMDAHHTLRDIEALPEIQHPLGPQYGKVADLTHPLDNPFNNPEMFQEAIQWLGEILNPGDMDYEDMMEQLNQFHPDKIRQMIDRKYDGGEDAFVNTMVGGFGGGMGQQPQDLAEPSNTVPNQWQRDPLEQQFAQPSGLTPNDPRNSSSNFEVTQVIPPGPSTVEVEQAGEVNPLILQHNNPDVLDQAKDTLKSAGLFGDIGGLLGGVAGAALAPETLGLSLIPGALAGGLLGKAVGTSAGNDVGGILGDLTGAGQGIPTGQADNLNTLSHMQGQDDMGEAPSFSLNDDVGKAFLKAFPALAEFAHSPESGANHPDIAQFSMIFDNHFPGLKDQPISPEVQAEIDSLKKGPEPQHVSAYEIIHMGAYPEADDPGEYYQMALRQGLPYPADQFDLHSQPNMPINFGDMGASKTCTNCGGEGTLDDDVTPCPNCQGKGELSQAGGPSDIHGEGATTPYNLSEMSDYNLSDLGAKLPMRQGAYPPRWGDFPEFRRHADGWTTFQDEYSSPNSVPNRVNTDDPNADGIDSGVHGDNPGAWQRMDDQLFGGGSASSFAPCVNCDPQQPNPECYHCGGRGFVEKKAAVGDMSGDLTNPNYMETHPPDTQFPTVPPKQDSALDMLCPSCGSKMENGLCPQCNKNQFQMMQPQQVQMQQQMQQQQSQNQIMQNSQPYLPSRSLSHTAGIGPNNLAQAQMILQYLRDNGQDFPGLAEDIINNPDNYAEALSAIQQQGPIPQAPPGGAGSVPPPPVPGGGGPPMPPPGGDSDGAGQTVTMQASRTAADTSAPQCPECGTHTTELLDADGNCRCHSCNHYWKADINPENERHSYGATQQYNPWVTEDGQDLHPGMKVQMFTQGSPIPDEVEINAIGPTGNTLTYTLAGPYGLNHQTEVTKEEAQMDGLYFKNTDQGQVNGDVNPPTMERPPPDYEQNSDTTGFTGMPETDNMSVQSSMHCSNCGRGHDLSSDLCGNCAFDATYGDGLVKQAGKDFSHAEKMELINEPGTARNSNKLNLQETHYLNTLDDDDFLFL